MPDITPLLIDRVRDANSQGVALNILGRGSKAFYGRPAVGETLNVCQHSGIVSYEASELVLTARAGTPLSDLALALSEQGQMMPFDPPCFGGDGSLGGTLACNQSGPVRPWAGSIRDAVLGVRLIDGKGDQLRFGGQVMKNVAGFDVARLQAGAMGCLGVITEISLKVMPKPAHSQTVSCDIDSAEDALSVMNYYRAHATPISAACWYLGRIYLRFCGAHRAVDSAVAQFRRRYSGAESLDGEEFWRHLRDHQLHFFSGAQPLWRVSTRATEPLLSMNQDCLIDWGGAQRWLRSTENAEQLRSTLLAGSGQVTLFRGGDRANEVFHPPSPVAKTLHQRLKHSFDENCIFNRGRLYSWL